MRSELGYIARSLISVFKDGAVTLNHHFKIVLATANG